MRNGWPLTKFATLPNEGFLKRFAQGTQLFRVKSQSNQFVLGSLGSISFQFYPVALQDLRERMHGPFWSEAFQRYI